jgi:hypothetical protein
LFGPDLGEQENKTPAPATAEKIERYIRQPTPPSFMEGLGSPGIKKLLGKVREAPSTDIRVPNSGSSAFTILIKAATEEIFSPQRRRVDESVMTNIVSKWVRERDANNELLCTKMAGIFGLLTVPTIKGVSKETSRVMVTPTKKAKPAFDPSPFTLLVMNRLPGSNLQDLCNSGDIHQFNQSSWNTILREVGLVSSLDLFLANFDRFFRAKESNDFFELLKSPQANLGNVVIETTPQKRNVSSISMIDTTSILQSTLKAPSVPEETFDMGGLFGDEPEPIIITPPTTPVRFESAVDLSVNRLHDFFILLATKISNEDSASLEDHIVYSLEKSLGILPHSSMNEEEAKKALAIREKIELARQDLRDGLKDGLRRLSSADFELEAAAVLDQEPVTKLSRLMSQNLQWLKENRLKSASIDESLDRGNQSAASS